MNSVLQYIIKNILVPAIVSAGVIAAYVKFWFEKRSRAHELKLKKYMDIAAPLSKLYGGNSKDDVTEEFVQKMNELFFFASDDVVKELLIIDKKMRPKDGKGPKPLCTQDFKNLIVAIRRDLGLGTSALRDEKDFCMFQVKKSS